MLTGTEVKSLRAGKANIAEAYAAEKEEEIWLINCTISRNMRMATGSIMNLGDRENFCCIRSS